MENTQERLVQFWVWKVLALEPKVLEAHWELLRNRSLGVTGVKELRLLVVVVSPFEVLVAVGEAVFELAQQMTEMEAVQLEKGRMATAKSPRRASQILSVTFLTLCRPLKRTVNETASLGGLEAILGLLVTKKPEDGQSGTATVEEQMVPLVRMLSEAEVAILEAVRSGLLQLHLGQEELGYLLCVDEWQESEEWVVLKHLEQGAPGVPRAECGRCGCP